jgi:nitrate/nitrite-specific signal transduction histidine kinase
VSSRRAASAFLVPVFLLLADGPGVGQTIRPALERTGDARATQVTVSLRSQPEGVELRIKDDGRGFDPARIKPSRLGLDILRERAEAIDATLQITSQADQGTEIAVIWSDTQQRERKAND